MMKAYGLGNVLLLGLLAGKKRKRVVVKVVRVKKSKGGARVPQEGNEVATLDQAGAGKSDDVKEPEGQAQDAKAMPEEVQEPAAEVPEVKKPESGEKACDVKEPEARAQDVEESNADAVVGDVKEPVAEVPDIKEPASVAPAEDANEQHAGVAMGRETAEPETEVAPTLVQNTLERSWPYYEGGVSQWREEPQYEQMWSQWDWPPRDWRPSNFHEAFWNADSRWHVYNNYDWNQYSWKEPTEKKPYGDYYTPGRESDATATPSSEFNRSFSRSSSLELEEVTAHLQRCTTGEIVESEFNKRLAEAVDVPSGGHLKDGNGENKPKGKGDEAEETKGVAGNDEKKEDKEEKDSQKVNTEKKEGEEENKEKKDCQQVNNEKKDGAENSKEEEERKKKAHARYMRYYRNIRSASLSFSMLLYLSWLCFSHTSCGLRSEHPSGDQEDGR